MKIKKTIELPEGAFTFEGEISDVEHDFIIEAGINFLIQQGVVPFKILRQPEDKGSFVTGSEEKQ